VSLFYNREAEKLCVETRKKKWVLEPSLGGIGQNRHEREQPLRKCGLDMSLKTRPWRQSGNGRKSERKEGAVAIRVPQQHGGGGENIY